MLVARLFSNQLLCRERKSSLFYGLGLKPGAIQSSFLPTAKFPPLRLPLHEKEALLI